jgi:hypothetical protein
LDDFKIIYFEPPPEEFVLRKQNKTNKMSFKKYIILKSSKNRKRHVNASL